ncbi:ABC transporter ATP-binding protein [Clostridium sp. KNHs216]|uniref:ABC transporter ATP-binding protein n=1 Tax=Clostridium sp. KNHs216 TaxID=1550235 RepID=UPI0011517D24|nr:ABC transporter ATP-binding protein [Clostridium sp. KNHs216]TQI65630.1 NitT/TauT family transport system ATP-binding protein [Clostridium sp. KNHs216]
MKIDHLTKNYNGKTVLEQFSLELPSTGTVCLFGPSGCGKTTLLNCIAGLEPFDSGEIEGAGTGKISYLFQENRLLPWISAKDNIAAVLRGKAGQNAEQAEKWLSLVGLAEAGNKRPAELSGGMRRRVALARALAYGGDLYLMDEPFQGLDAERRDEMIALLQKETAGALKIIVTHDFEEAEMLADVIYILEGPPVRIADIIVKNPV